MVVNDIRSFVVDVVIKHAAAAQNHGHDAVTPFIIYAIFGITPANSLFDRLLSIVDFGTSVVGICRSAKPFPTQKAQTAAKQILETATLAVVTLVTVVTLFYLPGRRISIVNASSRVDGGCN